MSETGAGLTLSSPVTALTGVGRSRASALKRLGIVTISDLLRHRPLRYQREEAESWISQLQLESIGSARGTVMRCRWVRPMGRGKQGRFEAVLEDGHGALHLVWFNAGYLRDRIHPGARISVQGKVTRFGDYLQMVNPRWSPIEEEEKGEAEQVAESGSYRPIYPATEELSSPVIEKLVQEALPAVIEQIRDPLPGEVVRQNAMPVLADAFRWLHEPEHEEQASSARRRLAFNELLLLQLGIEIKRHYNDTALQAWPLRHSEAIDGHIRARFPFELTAGQETAVREIVADLQRERPMNRLVQGDVGSGKTVVALYALLMAVAARKQGALMAPTELLAEQHYLSISRMLEGSNVRIELISSGRAASGSALRKETLERVRAGEVDLVIGTQALVSEQVQFRQLGVVVIDEQHRFGVLQRAAFRDRAGEDEEGVVRSPHYLVMTATPIPRTLSLTVFGDLDVSVIRGLPPGRTPIESRVMPPERADAVYAFVGDRVKKGDQAYVVVPVVEESRRADAAPLRSVKEHESFLKEKLGKDVQVAAIHGRLKRETRERIMEKFRDGKIDVLVATTVIEVGVDVPNATLMVIEHAERFGVAQLHQLRGRIGRGGDGRKSVCVFIADPTTEEAKARLEAVAQTTDGFRIAEKDLEIRGMGDFFGTKQHGLPPMRVASLPQDMDLLMLAKRNAQQIVQEDPHLDQDRWRMLRKILLREFGEALGLVDVG